MLFPSIRSFFVCALFSISLALVLGPVHLFHYLSSYDNHRLMQILVLGISVLVLGLNRLIGPAIHDNTFSRTRQFLLLFFSLGVLASALGVYGFQSLQDLGLMAGAVLCALLIKESLKGVPQTTLVRHLDLLLLPGLVYAIHMGFQYVFLLNVTGFSGSPELINFANRRQFNDLQCVLLPFYVYLAVFRAHKIRVLKFVSYFVAVVWLVLAVYSGARALLLSLAVGLLFLYFYFPALVRPNVKKLFYLGLTTVMVYFALFVLIPWFMNEPETTNVLRIGSSGRVALWLFTASRAFDCWAGCGGQSFVALTTDYYPRSYGSPHNSILVFLYEYGILGLLAALAVWLLILSRALKSVKTPLQLCVVWALLTVSIDSLFSGFQYYPLGAMVLPLFVAIGLLYQAESNSSSGDGKIRKYVNARHLNAALYTLLSVLFLLCALSLYLDSIHYPAPPLTDEVRYPRFYGHGGFFLL